tara:strand:- start:908 stop:1150 length:243 start_codon:yes stop_codon:yes gene_type:complete
MFRFRLMIINVAGKILAAGTALWGLFLLLVYWTTYLEMELFDDDEIITMACLNTISFTAITVGFFVFRINLGDKVVIQSK